MSETALTGGGDAGGAGQANGGAPGSAGSGAGGSGAGGSGGGAGQGGSGGAASWRDSLPEDIRANPAISSFQDIPSLTKAFIETKSMVGKKGVIVPGEKATDEDWGNFYKSLGVPEADKYELAPPQGVELDEGFVSAFKETALKAGLLPRQASAMLAKYSEFQKQGETAELKEIETIAKQQMEGLKKEWGDGYDKEIRTAQVAVKEVGGDDFIKYLNETGLGNDVQVIKFMSKVGKLLGEDKLREGGAISTDAQTRTEIQGQLDELRANGDANGLYDKSHPMHSVTLARLESLAKRLTGGR